MDANGLLFDDGMKSLEAMVQKLEGGSMGLEDAIKCYEEGTRLSRELQKKLEDAQRRVEVLRRGEGGEYAAEPLEPARRDAAAK
jgi:exodeoxyribonuclease VII small subunit